MGAGEILSFFGILVVFCALLFLAYVTTKYVGNKANKSLRGKYISVVETVNIGLDKQLHLVKAGEDHILIASSGKNIEFLSKIAINEITGEESAESSNLFDFKSLFEKYVHALKGEGKKESKEPKSGLESVAEGEAFKKNLKRLKSINLRVSDQENNDGDGITNEK